MALGAVDQRAGGHARSGRSVMIARTAASSVRVAVAAASIRRRPDACAQQQRDGDLAVVAVGQVDDELGRRAGTACPSIFGWHGLRRLGVRARTCRRRRRPLRAEEDRAG